ncbi:hypothetical protein AMATHDRAFT_65800 [Amanita thiersii Skay4041]|uniref:Uncharacterized protein n=1 Tax=Amanita thiersii Skay4041 TaxID=703135 RepID=A0A2A9NJ44_9AGAR|nr:hypothetical protein AMATHDRAFT_65800 [Amanita thiersii Skay4041]
MLFTQQQEQSNSKRKATTGSQDNPLLSAAKRAKKESKNASNKSKLRANAETTSSGLLIVRDSSSSQPEPLSRETSLTSQFPPKQSLKRTASADLHARPSKKLRAESQPHTNKPKSASSLPTSTDYPRTQNRAGSLPPANGSSSKFSWSGSRGDAAFATIAEEDEAQIEDDIRAMDAEADHIRRSSRVYVPPSSSSSITFQQIDKDGRRPKPKPSIVAVDTTQLVPMDETPRIERNKRLREGSLNPVPPPNGDATHAETSQRGREREREVNGHHRRKSSISGRGKRISSSFESSGVIPQPHNTVSENSFYKHLDADLPDTERFRQLLIWCSSRAISRYASAPLRANSTSSTSSKDNPKNQGDSPPDLPPLSSRATELLRKAQDDVIRMLADRKIDLSVYGDDQQVTKGKQKELRPNEQNVMNRKWEIIYAEEIKRAQEEDEAWKRVAYFYDTYLKRQKESLEKRLAAAKPKQPPGATEDQVAGEDEQLPKPSAKAKGKQRDTGEEEWDMLTGLPESMQRGDRLARALLLPQSSSHPKSPATPKKRPRRSSSTALPAAAETVDPTTDSMVNDELRAKVVEQLKDIQFNFDSIVSLMSAGRSMVKVAEAMLDRRFALLNQNLASRANINLGPLAGPLSSSSSASSASSSAVAPAQATSVDPSNVSGILSKYVPHLHAYSAFMLPHYEEGYPQDNPNRSVRGPGGINTLDLIRALTRVDRMRPPAMVGDAARRAAREVQRVGESGVGAVGERRITTAGGCVLHTPRKMPATPRRGGDRTPRRDRTPGRDR